MKDLQARDVGHAALDELRSRGGAGITVRGRDHGRQLLTAWEQIPTDGSDYEWSTILHDVAEFVLDDQDDD